MTATEPRTASFETTVTAFGNNTGIVVPPEVIDALAAGKRPPVLVDLDGYRYRNTVGVMGGRHLVSVSSAVRSATGLQGGDPVRVTLTVADTLREVAVPEDLAAALAADEEAGSFFANLSNSLQRYRSEERRVGKEGRSRWSPYH